MGEEDPMQTARARTKRNVFDRMNSNDTSTRFRLQAVTSKCGDLDRYGAWGPERVILMGRTGCGKSTLFQMLIKGKGLGFRDPSSNSVARASIRGETTKVTRGEGRGFYVVDTPGFGELKDKHHHIHGRSREEITKYVDDIEGTYSHFIYVVTKDRIDMLEQRLWGFFTLLFGGASGGAQIFTVVVSKADQTWVEQNLSALQRDFSGCESFPRGEFPPTATDDDEWKTEL